MASASSASASRARRRTRPRPPPPLPRRLPGGSAAGRCPAHLLHAEHALYAGQRLGERLDGLLDLLLLGVAQLVVGHEVAALLELVHLGVGVVERLLDLLVQRRVLGLHQRGQGLVERLGAVQVGHEGRQVELGVALLLAGDLGLLDLVDQLGGAGDHDLGLDHGRAHQRVQALGVGDQAGGQLLRVGRDLLVLPEVTLDRVEAGPVRVRGLLGEVVLAGVDLAVQLGEQRHQRLDPLVVGPALLVGLLGRGHVAGVDGLLQRAGGGDQRGRLRLRRRT